MTQLIQHSDLVKALVKPGEDILDTISPSQVDGLHMSVGIAGEAGELLDAIKKWVIYNKPLDRANVIEELGDLEFYMEGLRQSLNITREETVAANIAKLSVRYAGLKYTDTAAQTRVDKAEPPKLIGKFYLVRGIGELEIAESMVRDLIKSYYPSGEHQSFPGWDRAIVSLGADQFVRFDQTHTS